MDAAVWREIASEEPQPRAAFVEALSALIGRWLLVRSDAPEMDLITRRDNPRPIEAGAKNIQRFWRCANSADSSLRPHCDDGFAPWIKEWSRESLDREEN